MTNLFQRIRKRRMEARQARELREAIANAPSHSVREELLIASQRIHF